MNRPLLIFLLAAPVYASVICMQADDATANGTWTLSGANNTAGTCVGGTRPFHYVISNDGETSTTFDRVEQAVFNDAWLGDKIIYKAGQTFIHGQAGGPHVTRRPGTGRLIVTTTEEPKLPADGTRITPAYAPLTATFITRGSKAGSQHGAPSFVLTGGPRSADHIEFRGLRFLYTCADDCFSFELNGGLLDMGNGGRYGASLNWTTTVTSAPVVGSSTVAVADTAGFAVTTPRQQVVINSSGDSPLYTIEGVDATAGTITVDPPISQTGSNYRVYTILNRAGESLLQPDDITIRQCLFVNPIPRVDASVFVAANSRRLTIRDSWFHIYSTLGGLEPKALLATEAYGPHIIENNVFFGGMSMMYGGSFSSTDASVAAGGVWRYNTFYNPNEYLLIGPWNRVLAEGNPSGFDADMSVAGLPPHSPRFVIGGRSIDEPTTADSHFRYWTAINSGVVGTVKPDCFGSGTATANTTSYCYDGDSSRPGTTLCGGVTYPGDGVCWRLGYGSPAQNAIKNAWESKSSSNQTLQYNVFSGYPPGYAYNTGQPFVINFKIASLYYGNKLNYPGINPGCRYDPVNGYNSWPECNRSYGDHFTLRNNWFKNVWGGLFIVGYYGRGGGVRAKGRTSGDWEISGNLIQMRGPLQNPVYRCIAVGRNNGDEREDPLTEPVPNINISQNTCYTPFGSPAGSTFSPISFGGEFKSPYDGAWDVYTGNRIFQGNIWARWGNGSFYRPTSKYDGAGHGEGKFVASFFPGTSRTATGTAIWGKNVVLGAAANDPKAGPYPTGTVWTGCDDKPDGSHGGRGDPSMPGRSRSSNNRAPCAGLTGVLPDPDYSLVFVDPAAGDFRVRDDHPFAKHGMPDGSDLGADPSQLAMIQNLQVIPTDRSVVLTWNVTAPIAQIPCVIEVNTAPDLESGSYAGELSEIARYYRQDADDADRNYRDGNRRMLIIGHSVPLHSATPYYYRLHCGGDATVGMFQTLPADRSNSTQTLTRKLQVPNGTKVMVEYGTLYSRSTDTISGGGSAPANCGSDSGQQVSTCVASFTAARGSIVYYRWNNYTDGNTLATLGTVEVTTAK